MPSKIADNSGDLAKTRTRLSALKDTFGMARWEMGRLEDQRSIISIAASVCNANLPRAAR
jgi:hypothetical protein